MQQDYIRINIVRLRKRSGLSQEQLADAIGMSARNFQRLENGKLKHLDAVLLDNIAKVVKADIAEFFENQQTQTGALNSNSSIGGSSQTTISDPGEEFMKFLNIFGQQQRAMFDAFIEHLRGRSK